MSIHPTAIIAPEAKLAPDVEVGPYSIVGPDVTLAAGVRLLSHVVVEGATTIGEGCNIIREHVTMHTGTASGKGMTTIGSDGLYMVGSHVAHDCAVGDFVVLAKGATLGGHVTIGDYVFMGGLAAAHQFSRIGRYSFIGGLAAVTKDVIPYGSVWGNHAHLEGLNLVGLKRRGFPRETINALRAAYRLMFADEGTFQERLDDVAEIHAGNPEVMEIVDFIRADANRPLCLPEREV
ncbi:MAG: acyl-[acyl-carrier-protein]--UDP-N-acetylglucosamine O-acyltransferase [Caulobacter vibrioides]|uniref:Acyl-[acyl-carrier-protein]--UDP-N-acetylglucosamine O-acyltransferase n=1 Tax=Caulobacter vibrioides TaxID=155892 RepID=A0A258CYZ5_CAUVI|nr:MAG: acyl-[acyl-carrier-protein]--UDP-N-acetylglucosamine O-acyltransferase [Caulobacter vibrioides]